jgi:four helix bundle protein
MGFLFEKLEVYQRGLEFAAAIESFCDGIAKGNHHLTNQLRRAALSISLNISEGSGRWHPRDKKQFYLIARGSAYECVPIIDLINRRGLLDEAAYKSLRNDLETIAKMLTKLIQSTDG